MKSKTNKIVSLLLSILIVAGIFAACGKKDNLSDTAESTTSVSTATSETDLYADLPEGSFGGYEFKILNNISNYGLTTMDSDNLGSLIDAAIFTRNSLVKDKLDIDIKVTEMDYTSNKETISRLSRAAGS